MVCGKVYPETCPTCPDRGGGRGVTVGHIEDMLRKCTKNADVTGCLDHFQRHIQILRGAGQECRTMAILIDNLVDYRRMAIRRGWC